MTKTYKILILCGLPGSGKTWWAKHNISRANIIHFDNYKGKSLKEIFESICVYGGRGCTIVLDGLFLTNSEVFTLIMEIYDILGKSDSIEIEIHQWEGDREDCLWNDMYRGRESLSKATILGKPIETINIDQLNEKIKEIRNLNILSRIPHKIHRFTTQERDFGNLNGILKSKTWCLGGTWGDSKGNHGTIMPEDTPEFFELLDYLNEVYPNINYQKIKNECAIINTKEYCDYYGGNWKDAWWECNLEKLYQLLENKKETRE